MARKNKNEEVNSEEQQAASTQEADAQALEDSLNENPHGDLAPLYADFEEEVPENGVSEEELNQRLMGSQAMQVGQGDTLEAPAVEPRRVEAKKIDGTQVVEQAPTLFDPILGRAEVPPVEYGFDAAENDNIDPIETDGKNDLKDRNRRPVAVIDPLVTDARRNKYPNRTLTARANRG